jgi:O-antigen/teichoic acid export membrane protein
MLSLRYLFVGLMNLGATTFLVRHLGAAAWASYGVALFTANSVDQYLGSKLLAGVIAARSATRELLLAGAHVMQVVGAGAVLAGLVLAVPIRNLTSLDAPEATCISAGICGWVFASRALAAAMMERDLRYRWVALGEVIDQVFFTGIAVSLVLLGAGIQGVLFALAIMGIPTMVLWRMRYRVPWLGRRTAATREIWRFAGPGSGVAACATFDGFVPLIALGSGYTALLGMLSTTASALSYPAVITLVLQRISFPTLRRVADDGSRLADVTAGVVGAACAGVTACIGLFALLSPLWMPLLFGAEWRIAWPLASELSGGVVLMAGVNVMLGALMARRRPRGALNVWLVMTAIWLLGSLVVVGAGHPAWTASAFIFSRAIGFAVAWHLLRADEVPLRVRNTFVASLWACLVMVAGAGIVSMHELFPSLMALAALLATQLLFVWSNREWGARVLRALTGAQAMAR